MKQKDQYMSQQLKTRRLEAEIVMQRDLISQLKKSLDNNIRLSKEIENLQLNLKEQEETIQLLEIRNQETEKLLILKNHNINELEEVNTLIKNQLQENSNCLAIQIEEKEKLRRKCRIFQLKRYGNFGSLMMIPTLLILRKDINGNFIVELENSYSKTIVQANDIIELNLCKENPSKFYIVYKVNVVNFIFIKFL